MQLTGKRIFSAVMLVGTVITVYQVMSKPQPVAQPVLVSVAQESARAFDEKLQQLQTPRPAGNAPAEVHFTSDEVSAEMAQFLIRPTQLSPRERSQSTATRSN